MRGARPRLRPVPWGWLAAVSAGLGGLATLVARRTVEPAYGLLGVHLVALMVGLLAAPLAAQETDPPMPVLLAAPKPLWRAYVLRWLAWTGLALASVSWAVAVLDGRSSLELDELAWAVAPNVLLAGALSVALARASSVLVGAGTAGGLLIVLIVLASADQRFPLRLLDGPESELWLVSRRWLTGSAALLLLAALPGWLQGGWWRRRRVRELVWRWSFR